MSAKDKAKGMASQVKGLHRGNYAHNVTMVDTNKKRLEKRMKQ